MAVLITPSGDPVEIQPGGGDLRYSSVPLGGSSVIAQRAVTKIGGKTISYGDIYATQPWVAAAVNKLLLGAIRVPLKVYRRTGDDSRERLRPADHPLAAAVVTPWRGGTMAALTMALLGPKLIHGNSTTTVESGAGDSIVFDAIDYRAIVAELDDYGRILGWNRYDLPGDGSQPLLSDQVLHIAYWSPLSDLGVSPLRQLGTTIAIEDAAQRYQVGLFANGARPPSAITADAKYLEFDKDEQAAYFAGLRQDVSAIYSGPDNAGRPALLPPGLDWKQVGHSAVEAELVEQRKVTREEVAAVYDVPPPMIGQLENATYSNIETQLQMFYGGSLGAPLVHIEQALNAFVVRDLLREDDVFVEFDFAGVLRGNRLEEIQSLREAIQTGLMSPNEGRGVINLPRSESEQANKLWMPVTNFAPIDTPPQTAPAAVPPAG